MACSDLIWPDWPVFTTDDESLACFEQSLDSPTVTRMLNLEVPVLWFPE
jgi:hypothetical protein